VTTAGSNNLADEYIDPKIERSLVRKFDLFILPMCGTFKIDMIFV
jgi:hypothetical protein